MSIFSSQVSQSDAPGENGKAHHVRVEQKPEEENQKGVYGFNQVNLNLRRNLRVELLSHWLLISRCLSGYLH